MIAITARCGACSVVYPGVKVGPNFRVKVEDHGRPVKGLRVEIGSSNNRTVADTDQNGLALFRSIRPGFYYLNADHDAGIPDGARLEVRSDGPTNVTVPLKWPSIAPILVRSLKGNIRGPDYLPGQSQPMLSLDLLEGISGRSLQSLRTTDTGEFNFGRTAPGLYFLRLKPSGLKGWSGEQVTGLVAVVVDSGASTDHLDVSLGWTSCGLWYADSSTCPQSDLRIEQLSGQVLDAAGAAIQDAKILVFDLTQTLVEGLQSDSAGKFTSTHALAGTYELVVSRAGFTSLHRTVHIEPTPTSTQSRLTVKLGLGGNCSEASTQSR